MPARILAIHAHPDDVEIQCAGTLCRLADRGCEVTIATMTAGDLGTAEMSRGEIAQVREHEARESATLLGADYFCLHFGDLSITHDDASRRRVTEAVRRARPDVVLTAPPVDYMSDHEITSRLVRDACFAASVPLYDTEAEQPHGPTERVPHLYYVDPVEGTDWYGRPVAPDFVVDVSETMDRKLAMLACHASQRNWLRRQHGIDEYLESTKRWAAERGAMIGTAFGEGFRQHRGHPHPSGNRLLELLGESPD